MLQTYCLSAFVVITLGLTGSSNGFTSPISFARYAHKSGRYCTEPEKENEQHMDNFNSIKSPSRINISRRKAIGGLISGLTLASMNPDPSEGACLAGDTSVDCIGVYKVPLDDAVSSYISTPEQLAKYAPDLKYVPPVQYPKNYQVAKDELVDLQMRVENASKQILKGELTDAGVELLALIPRITVCGRVVIQALENSGKDFSMKVLRCEEAHTELVCALSSCDIMIGMALAGRMGAITVAQIQILEDMKDAESQFKAFIEAMPANLSG